MINLYDRIKELSYTIGTGDITLSGPAKGFSPFSSVYASGNELFYAVTDGKYYEIGSGIYLSSPDRIKRFPIKSTSSNQLINFSEGLKEIYVTYPATNAVFNTSGIYSLPKNSGLTFWTSENSLSYSNKVVFDSGNGRIGINTSNPSVSIDVGGPSSSSTIRASGFVAGLRGVSFPSGVNDLSSYSGGVQLTHYEMNNLDQYCLQKGLIGQLTGSDNVLALSGNVNQYILFKKQSAGLFFAGPSGGCVPPCSPGYPTFRLLTPQDLPDLSNVYAPKTHTHTSFSNLDIGDAYSSTYLSLNLPNGLPNSTYRDISVLSINNGSTVFRVNGLGQIDYGTIDVSQINNLSGYLSSAISATASNTSGINNVTDGRLSISSTQSVCDGSGRYLYYTPHIGSRVSLPSIQNNKTTWTTIDFSQGNSGSGVLVADATTLPIQNYSGLDVITPSPDTIKYIYDIYGYLNNNSIKFYAKRWSSHDRSVVSDVDTYVMNPENSFRLHTNDLVQGIYCHSEPVGSTIVRGRYLGTVMTAYMNGSYRFVDVPQKRLIYNANNKLNRSVSSIINYEPDVDETNSLFIWAYDGEGWRKIPYLDPIEVINGVADSNVDLTLSLQCNVFGVTESQYMCGVVPEDETGDQNPCHTKLNAIYNSNIYHETRFYYNMTSGINNLMYADIMKGAYGVELTKTLSSRTNYIPYGYMKFFAVENNLEPNGFQISILDRRTGSYGIMGTYLC